MRRAVAALLPLALLLSAGCSNQGASAPRLDPAAATGQALAEYDQNKDGALNAKELERCPALRQSLRLIDKNGDGRISAEELTDRLRGYAAGERYSFPCRVTLDGKPLAGATVTFVPEKFLGPAFRKAVGVTDGDGSVYMQEEGRREDGLSGGLYRIEVLRKDAQGKETLPARFNSQTTLGEEVAGDTLGRGGDLSLNLKSR